jgi:hypothetical protein
MRPTVTSPSRPIAIVAARGESAFLRQNQDVVPFVNTLLAGGSFRKALLTSVNDRLTHRFS